MALNPDMNASPYIRPRLRLWVWAFRILLGLALIIMTFEALVPSIPSDAPLYFDKILHFGAFAVLTGLTLFAMPRIKLTFIFAWLTVYGGMIEAGQGLMNWGRTASLFDLMANIVGTGVILGLWIVWIQFRLRRRDRTILNSPIT